MKPTFIEKHLSFSVSEFEGLWEMTFIHPFNKEEPVTVYVIAPNSDTDTDKYKDKTIVKAGPRLSDVLSKLIYQIESYPYSWDLAGKKIVSYGYDFESDFTADKITKIDLTEIAFQEVNEHYNFFSDLESRVVSSKEYVSSKGVIAKLKIEMDRPKYINHLAMDFFTEYPIRLMSLMYEENKNKQTIVHEIPLKKVVQSNNSIFLHFPIVYAKTFTLIINQESYVLGSRESNQKQLALNEVWSYASASSKYMYENTVVEYLNELIPVKTGVELHQEVLDSYKTINKNYEPYSTTSMNEYREDFDTVKNKMDNEQR